MNTNLNQDDSQKRQRPQRPFPPEEASSMNESEETPDIWKVTSTWDTGQQELDCQKELHPSLDVRMMAYDTNPSRSKVFVVSTVDRFASMALEAFNNPNFMAQGVHPLFGYECLSATQPLCAYFVLKYNLAENPDRDPDLMVTAVLKYIKIVLEEELNFHDQLDIVLQECHREGKVRWNLTFPNLILKNLATLASFVARAALCIQSNCAIDRYARMLKILQSTTNGTQAQEKLFIDTSVYGTRRYIRTLASSKFPQLGDNPHPFVLTSDTSDHITIEQWKNALIQRPLPTSFLHVPATSASSNRQAPVAHEVSNTLKCLGSQLLKSIDQMWGTGIGDVKITFFDNEGSTSRIMSDGIRITSSHSHYCPLKKGEHGACVTSITLTPNSAAKIECFSDSHSDDAAYRHVASSPALENVLFEVWNTEKWMDAFNRKFTQVLMHGKTVI